MKLGIGFDGWSQVSQIMCGLLLIFSFAGDKTFGNFYDIMLAVNVFAIFISLICICITAYYQENKL
jgi:hypothetical protein